MKFPFQADRSDDENKMMLAMTHMVTVNSAVQEGIILDDDLAMIPEVIPHVVYLAGIVRDDIYRYHSTKKINIKFPIIRNCFGYCFGKGFEFALLWHESPSGKIEFSHDSEKALTGKIRPDFPENLSAALISGTLKMEDVFCDFQDKVLADENFGAQRDDRWVADLIACGLYSSTMIGIDYGMNAIGFK